MLSTIQDIMDKDGLTSCEKIVIQVGELSGVIPHFMEECFPAATYQTPFEDTELELEVIPGICRCNKCGTEYNAYQYNLTCPKCGAEMDSTPLTGQELVIKQIFCS